MNIKWTEFEKKFVKDNAGTLTDKQIGERLGKSRDSVRKTRQRMGIPKESGRGVCKLLRNADKCE